MGAEENKFYDYYKSASDTPEAVQRSQGIYDSLIACMQADGVNANGSLAVADIGCGAGTQSLLWARQGHTVRGIDVNDDLIGLAKERASAEGSSASFETGRAESLPWSDAEFDVCIVPELLEHVEKWERCLDEVCRVVKPGGYLYLTTTNRWCPSQEEFKLVGYSWYPAWLKRRCLELARTTKKHWVEYAEYPAVNWFSPAMLADELTSRGYASLDRFDIMLRRSPSGPRRTIATLATATGATRFVAQCLTPYTVLIARNEKARQSNS